MLKFIKSRVNIPVFVMIRPRGGDFLYSEDEFEVMKEDVRTLKSAGADGIVFGMLTRQVGHGAIFLYVVCSNWQCIRALHTIFQFPTYTLH